jgi:hypothetical protein
MKCHRHNLQMCREMCKREPLQHSFFFHVVSFLNKGNKKAPAQTCRSSSCKGLMGTRPRIIVGYSSTTARFNFRSSG